MTTLTIRMIALERYISSVGISLYLSLVYGNWLTNPAIA